MQRDKYMAGHTHWDKVPVSLVGILLQMATDCKEFLSQLGSRAFMACWLACTHSHCTHILGITVYNPIAGSKASNQWKQNKSAEKECFSVQQWDKCWSAMYYPPPTPHPKSLVYTCRGLSPLPHDIWPLSAKAHHFTSETVLQYVKSLAGFGQTLSLWCVKVKLTFLELCPIGAFEIEITVCRGQYSFFTGRGLNYSMWKQINFVEFGSTWLIILCFTAEENDAFSFFLFSIWRPANQLCKCYLQCNRAIKTFNIIQVS